MPTIKLTPEMVREARRRAAAGEPVTEIAEDYPAHYETVWSAIVGNTWKHVKNPGPVQPGNTRGSQHPDARLTPDDVREARRRYAAGESFAEIAEDFPVASTTISSAVRGQTWTHIKDQPPIPNPDTYTNPTAGRSEGGQRIVDAAMPPDEATPCIRCGLLSLGRYCRYCYQEGHAQRYPQPETQNPQPTTQNPQPIYGGRMTTATSGRNQPREQNSPHLPAGDVGQVPPATAWPARRRAADTPIYGPGE